MINIDVRKSISIKCHHKDAISIISNLKSWPNWSPWLKLEPSCTLEFHGTQQEIGASYLWHGDLIGAGNITLIDKGIDFLTFDLHFLKPFKSTASVTFEVLEHENDTTVTWIMSSQLPWYLFFFKKLLKSGIQLDFRRGLLMLKQYIETSSVASEVRTLGIEDQPSITYVGLKGRANLDALDDVISGHLSKLKQLLDDKKTIWDYPVFLLLEEMDKESEESTFFVCIPIDSKIDVPAPYICEQLQRHKVLTVEHKGEYQFLGNAWSLAFHEIKHQKSKPLSNPIGIEWYSNNPNSCLPSEIETLVRVFIKS